MNWVTVKLGELYEVHNGLSKGRGFFGSGYPFLTFSTVFDNYFLPNKLDALVQSTVAERENYSIQRGDVFVTRTSETSDELGMSCVALKDYPNATYNGFTKRMRPFTDRVLPEFIGYYMRMPSFRREFQAFSTMTTRASLKNEDLLGLKIWLPEKDIQKKIANILSTYDKLIENNQKQIKLLEEAAQRLYKEWFIDFRFPGYENKIKINNIPTDWIKTTVGNLVPVLTGKKDANYGTEDGDYPFFTCSKEPIKSPTFSFDTNAVILAGNGDFSVKLYRGKFEAYQRTYVLSPYELKHLYLVYFSIKESLNKLFKGASGSTIKFLTKKMIEEIEVLMPPDNNLNMYNKNMDSIQTKIEVLKSYIQFAVEARERLLPKLMSGDIEV